jgi:L-Ala-D/L-Glu epimerase
MRVRHADIWRVRLPFRWKVRHALAEHREAESIILRITLDNGVTGLGECIPREYVTSENAEKVESTLRDVWLPLLKREAWRTLPEVTAFLGWCSLSGASGCAFELALWDAVARSLGLIGLGLPLRRQTMNYSGVLPGLSLSRLSKAAWLARLWRFRALKVKVGIGEDDVERVRIVRRIVGRSVDIRVDANCAWKDPEVALRQIRALQRFNVSSVEEPLPARNWDGLAYLADKSPIPICVDESLTNAEDAHTLVERRACQLFNLRISKCGGILNCLRLADIARSAGIRYQVGCHVGETGILSAAGRNLFMALPDALHAEGSFGRILLKTDLTRPTVQFGPRGKAKPLTGAGLGIDLRLPLDGFGTNHTRVSFEPGSPPLMAAVSDGNSVRISQ